MNFVPSDRNVNTPPRAKFVAGDLDRFFLARYRKKDVSQPTGVGALDRERRTKNTGFMPPTRMAWIEAVIPKLLKLQDGCFGVWESWHRVRPHGR